MNEEHPKDGDSGPEQVLLRVLSSLAFWMRVLALLGLLSTIIHLLLRHGPVDSEYIVALVAGLISIVLWLFLLQCAASFRRVAREHRAGAESLADALWQLRNLFCALVVLIIVITVIAVTLTVRSAIETERQRNETTKQQIRDAERESHRKAPADAGRLNY